MNSIFSCIGELSKEMGKNKNGTSQNFEDLSRLVAEKVQMSNKLQEETTLIIKTTI